MEFKKVNPIFVLLIAFGFSSLEAAQRPALPAPRSSLPAAVKPVQKTLPKAAPPKPPPCREEAGISKAAIEQRRSIQMSTREQIELICSQPGLTDAQRRAQIAAAHKSAQAQIDAIIPPAAREKMAECNKARQPPALAHPPPHVGAGVPHPGGGPCAQFSGK